MAAATLYLAKPSSCFTPKIPFPSNSRVLSSCRFGTLKPKAGLSQFLNIVETTSSYIQLPLQLELHEPSNALSLPTWAVHVSSVVE
ncbi:Ycf49-like protein, partial [Trifolium pratense]